MVSSFGQILYKSLKARSRCMKHKVPFFPKSYPTSKLSVLRQVWVGIDVGCCHHADMVLHLRKQMNNDCLFPPITNMRNSRIIAQRVYPLHELCCPRTRTYNERASIQDIRIRCEEEVTVFVFCIAINHVENVLVGHDERVSIQKPDVIC